MRRESKSSRGPTTSVLERLLVPLDGSSFSEGVLTFVRWVVTHREAEVMLVGVLNGAEPSPEDSVESTSDYLEWQRNSLLVDGTNVQYEVLTNPTPAEAILSFAREYEPSLIAMSTHGRAGADRWIRGSVTESVLRASPCPVLTCNAERSPDTPEELQFRRILVPLDGSERSGQIIPVVRELAALSRASVTLLHVIEPAPVPVQIPVAVGAFAVPEMTPIEADALLETFRWQLVEPGISVRAMSARGTAAATILRVAEDERVDLVAMTTHGRSGLSRLFFGSVAEEVLRHCRCPSLVNRTAGLP